jgi:hypothetical protein
VTDASLWYRRLWRACLLSGLFGIATLAPLLSAAQVELEMAGGAAQGSGIADVVQRGVVPTQLQGIAIVFFGLVCLFTPGRLASRRIALGLLALVTGAALVSSDNWIVLKDAWKPDQRDIATVYAAVETTVWLASALVGALAFSRLWPDRSALDGTRTLAAIASFERIGRSRRRRHRTYRPSRLAWMIPAGAIAIALVLALQILNANVLRTQVLRIPPDLYRNAAKNQAFVEANPGIATLSALADIAQVIVTIVAVALVMRFFWRLVVADARRLLDDPTYRPIVFLRSFADDAAAVTSKRLFDRLVFRRRRLEEVAVAALAPLGTAIAIGQPGESLPKLGALRAYYADDEWQAAVLEWMRRAELVVLVAGTTRWTLWELRQMLHAHGDKLIVVVPPARAGAQRADLWHALARAAQGTPWETGLGGLGEDRAIVLRLEPDGHISQIRGDASQQADFELALRLAALHVLTPARSAGTPS